MRDYMDNPAHLRDMRASAAPLRRPLLIALVLCLLAGGVLWLDVRGMLAPFRSNVEQTISPVAARLTHWQAGLGDVWYDLVHWRQLRAENAALRQQLGQMQAELIVRERALVENTHLRQQLAIESQQPWHVLGAEVTVRSPDAVRRVMTVARGRLHGVAPGMAVVGRTGGPVALVGIVESVSDHTASVLLTTDFASRLSARVIHHGDSALGLVQGQWQRGSRLRLEQVERTSVLQEGAIVLTGGLTGELAFPLPLASVPASIPIGEVERLVVNDNTVHAELYPYADPDQVRYVWIILSQDD